VNVSGPSWLPKQAHDAMTRAGFDLLVDGVAQRYNALIAEHERLKPVETFTHSATSALLIGNTRALWPIFRAHISHEQAPLSDNPLDDYVERSLRCALQDLGYAYRIYFAHHVDEEMVSMLHAAEASTFAQRSPAHLALHPTLGPWFALRALVVVDHASSWVSDPGPDLCSSCNAPCVKALNDALSDASSSSLKEGMGTSWKRWVKVREACPLGRDKRYSDAQIRYHYARDRSLLLSS